MPGVIDVDALRRFDIRFSFVITFSAIASLTLIAITYWYWRETQSVKDTLVFFSVGAAAVGQITASFYTARVLAATMRRDDRDAKRADAAEARFEAQRIAQMKRDSLRFGERWNDASMFRARDALRKVHRHHATSEEDLKKFVDEQETDVMHVINFLEEIATACRLETVDPEIMRQQFDDIVVTTWRRLYPWIEKQRSGNVFIWEDLERLFDAWKGGLGKAN